MPVEGVNAWIIDRTNSFSHFRHKTMAAMASTRFLVQSSRASGRRQLHRTGQRNVSPCVAVTSPCSSLHTYSARQRAGKSFSTSLSNDVSVLAALQSTKAREGSSEEGWTSMEMLMSTVLAVAATGTFLLGSTMTSPSFTPKAIIHRGGGGGGGGGGGSSATPVPIGEKEEEEVVTVMDDGGGDSYQVSDTPTLVSF